jgi:hypothetical protein
MVKAALPYLGRGSSIVNTGSETGLQGQQTIGRRFGYQGRNSCLHQSIGSNADRSWHPGPIWTPFNVADKDVEEVSPFDAKTPLNRPGNSEEVAPAFSFLAAEQRSRYLAREIISVMGGVTWYERTAA